MQLLGLILLIASSWYIWKLSTNFFDDETKEGFNNDFKLFKNKVNETKNNFSMDKLDALWKKYKEEEDKSATKKD
tara:strand:- start:1307 stop:1531 length:225 start_codon:yes stop_codon:yes gene_type:complete